MSVYTADIKDVQAILLVINKTNSEACRRIIPSESFKEPILTMNELLKEFEEMIFYIYKVKGDTIGVAALKVENSKARRIRWVYVLPEHQRKGVGTSLIKHIENEAVKMKLEKLKVLTNDNAYWARNFYSELGYRLIYRVPKPWGDDAIYEKTLIQEQRTSSAPVYKARDTSHKVCLI